ncbi:MAG: ribonuclease P protein component [Methylococcales bacterium]|nr:ribonuclease P protein component [Methylococcales bacterium]
MTGRNAFSSVSRLKKPAQFQQVFAAPIKSSDAYFTLLAKVTEQRQPRLGLAISKKAARLAVQRNRLKRAIRESFRHEQLRLMNLDIVVMARKDAVQATSTELRESLRRHWHRLRKRCKSS